MKIQRPLNDNDIFIKYFRERASKEPFKDFIIAPSSE